MLVHSPVDAQMWQVHDEKRDKFEFVDFLTLIHRDLEQGARLALGAALQAPARERALV